MRVGPVVVSMVVHAGVLGLVVMWLERPPRHRDVPVSAPPPVPPEPLSIVDVELVEPGTGAASRPTTRAGGAHAASAQAAATTRSGDVPGAPAERPGPASSSLMRMRSLELPTAGQLAPIAERGEPRDAPRTSGRLENEPGGRAVIHDKVTLVTIDRDGTAHFHDKPDIDAHLTLPIPSLDIDEIRHDLGNTLDTWLADPYAATRFGRTQDLPRHLTAVPGECDSYGSLWCDDPEAPQTERDSAKRGNGGGLLGGNLDLTAYLMRKLHVGDPYASRKRKLLDDTLDERASRGGAFRTEQLDRSAELVHANLERLWRETADSRERRAVLFELWDECAEGDGPLGEAGQRARAEVIGWIRTHLPAGSPGAYSAEEIASLASRQASRQPFEPY